MLLECHKLWQGDRKGCQAKNALELYHLQLTGTKSNSDGCVCTVAVAPIIAMTNSAIVLTANEIPACSLSHLSLTMASGVTYYYSCWQMKNWGLERLICHRFSQVGRKAKTQTQVFLSLIPFTCNCFNVHPCTSTPQALWKGLLLSVSHCSGPLVGRVQKEEYPQGILFLT